jgi:hypothetical protein
VLGAAMPITTSPAPTDKDLLKVATHAATATLAYELVGLRTDAAVEPVKPSDCRYDSSPLSRHESQ